MAQGAAVAQIWPGARELPHATGMAKKKKKGKWNEICIKHLAYPGVSRSDAAAAKEKEGD